MACFGKIFSRKHGSFDLPVVENIIPRSKKNNRILSFQQKADVPDVVLNNNRSERESGLGSLTEGLNFESNYETILDLEESKPYTPPAKVVKADVELRYEEMPKNTPIPAIRSMVKSSENKTKQNDQLKIENEIIEDSFDGETKIQTEERVIQNSVQEKSEIPEPKMNKLTPEHQNQLLLELVLHSKYGQLRGEQYLEDGPSNLVEHFQSTAFSSEDENRQIKESKESVMEVKKFSNESDLSSVDLNAAEEASTYSESELEEVVEELPTIFRNMRALPLTEQTDKSTPDDNPDGKSDDDPLAEETLNPNRNLRAISSITLEEKENNFSVNQKISEEVVIERPPIFPPPPVPTDVESDEKQSAQHSIDELVTDSPGTLKKMRKAGVISDRSKDVTEIVIEKFPKSRDVEILIKDAIQANDFLNNLMDDERLEAVTEAMCPGSYPANSYIITEGDIGSHFFVSEEGTYEVVVDKNVVKSFGRGVVFGELAILYKAKRFASIRVTSEAKVWMLERKVFQKVMMKSGRREREENVKFLSTVSVLKDLELEKLHKVSDLLKREFYATGSTIVRQGDPGDKFYIIRGGSVNVIKADKCGRERLVGTLQRGAYFGEQALLHEDRRLASIIANPPGTECLTLNRIAFNEFLGGLETLRAIKLMDERPRESYLVNANSEFMHIQLHDLKYIGTLGIGGFGRVELVQYKSQQTFALKYLKKIEMVRQQQQEHAYSEKDIMLSCNSPFIVRLYKTYRDRKYLYFLMEACLGGDVWTILQKHKYFDEKVAKFMTACVVEAFEYLHSRNMIYRDLKPENLMLDDRGYIKLVDFGFAKRIGQNQKTYTFAGTPEYVSPEIILNKGHDKAVDYWALGVFIHELLVGKPPFRGKNHMKTYNAILRGIDIIEFSSRIPKKANILIKRLCRQVAAERLGNQKNGITDIKQHTWFSNFDWIKLQNRSMLAPLIRSIKSDTDLSNFDEYPKDQEEPPDENSGWDINF